MARPRWPSFDSGEENCKIAPCVVWGAVYFPTCNLTGTTGRISCRLSRRALGLRRITRVRGGMAGGQCGGPGGLLFELSNALFHFFARLERHNVLFCHVDA